MKKKCKKKSKGRLIQNPNYYIPSLPLHTSERAVLISYRDKGALTSSSPEMAGESKGSFF
jgi:hypothetical protein